jgi:hypothetical protein
MNAQTKIGGVNRDGLLRVWLLFYLWAFVSGFAAPQASEERSWFIMVGSAATVFLLYRRNRLAGIVGFLVGACVLVPALPDAWQGWTHLVSGRFLSVPSFRTLPFALYHVAFALVPIAVLSLHVASRHRILRGFEGREHSRGRVVTPSSYYLITIR